METVILPQDLASDAHLNVLVSLEHSKKLNILMD
jgi:hypothetical protein